MCDNISSDRRGEAAAQLCLKRRLTGYAPGSLKLRVSVPAVVVRVKERYFNSMIELKKKTAQAIFGLTGGVLSVDEIFSCLEYPPDSSMGDLALPCFRFAKTMRKNPAVIAKELADSLCLDEAESASAVAGYLNIKIKKEYWKSVVDRINSLGDNYGKNDSGAGKTVVIDYSSPNVAKPFHIGHLGTTVIGHTIKNLHEFSGYRCIGINHLGDWGTQFGKEIYAYRRWGSKEAVEKNGIDELVSIYVKFHEEAEKDPSLNDLAREEFRKLEQNDPDNISLWKWFIDISIAEYKKTYELLGIEFDSYCGESFYTDKMQEQIDIMREKGLLELDDGASIVNLEKYGMPPCLILKRDGSTLYPTRDIAAAVYRKRTYDFDKCIYVTSSGQSLHFAQWFKVVELMGYDWYDRLVHIPYGTLSIGGEKLATRTGNVILLKDLFNTATEKCLEIINEKNPALADKQKVASAIGVGAVVFHYLLNSRIKDSDFSMEAALSFDGNTGPYAQYTYARCCSILEKAGACEAAADDKDTQLPFERDSEIALAKELARFPEVVIAALEEYEPCDITRYALDICTAFNKFYQECRIISDTGVNMARVRLVSAAKTVLGSALHIICMKTPSKI